MTASSAPPPRRITREAQKAETKLINIERRRQNAVLRHESELREIASERRVFVLSLPLDVVDMLIAGGVVQTDELPETAEA